MSKEEILNTFYDSIVYERAADGWKTPFNPDRMKGVKLVGDLIDAEPARRWPRPAPRSPARLRKKLASRVSKSCCCSPKSWPAAIWPADLINEQTGEIYRRGRRRAVAGRAEELEKSGARHHPTCSTSTTSMSAPISATPWRADKNTAREDALFDIYRVMRPGEPPTLEAAEALFNGLFFDPERYDLSRGRPRQDELCAWASSPDDRCACCARKTFSRS